jgi:hypothetical protein
MLLHKKLYTINIETGIPLDYDVFIMSNKLSILNANFFL